MFRLSLKGKIMGIIIFIVLISMISVVFTIVKMQTIGGLTQTLYLHPFPVTTNVLEASKSMVLMQKDLLELALTEDETAIEPAINDILEKQKQVIERFAVIEERIVGSEGKELVKAAETLFLQWEPIRNDIIDLVRKKDRSAAAQMTKEKGALYIKQLIDSMDKMTAYAYDKATGYKSRSEAALQLVNRISIILCVFMIAISLVIGFFFAKNLSNPILQAVMNLNTTSAELLAAVQQQSTSTKEQAVAVQQTTTTMEEISQTGHQISQKAKEVAQSAEATSVAGSSGLHAVMNADKAMSLIREQVEQVAENIVALSEKTQTIGDIITTVNDIAEQLNLLSLNAAIEAVGAGDQGRRFSIVANEIKNLADQAKDSTVQIRTILTDIQKDITTSVMSTEESVKRVDIGQSASNTASDAIKSLTDTTQESVQAFQQIVASTNQQQIGMEQVAEALKNIRIATEQTSSGVDQVEKSISILTDLGEALRNIVENK